MFKAVGLLVVATLVAFAVAQGASDFNGVWPDPIFFARLTLCVDVVNSSYAELRGSYSEAAMLMGTVTADGSAASGLWFEAGSMEDIPDDVTPAKPADQANVTWGEFEFTLVGNTLSGTFYYEFGAARRERLTFSVERAVGQTPNPNDCLEAAPVGTSLLGNWDDAVGNRVSYCLEADGTVVSAYDIDGVEPGAQRGRSFLGGRVMVITWAEAEPEGWGPALTFMTSADTHTQIWWWQWVDEENFGDPTTHNTERWTRIAGAGGDATLAECSRNDASLEVGFYPDPDASDSGASSTAATALMALVAGLAATAVVVVA